MSNVTTELLAECGSDFGSGIGGSGLTAGTVWGRKAGIEAAKLAAAAEKKGVMDNCVNHRVFSPSPIP